MIHSRSAVVKAAKLRYKSRGSHHEYKTHRANKDDRLGMIVRHNAFYAEKDDDILFPWDMDFNKSLVERIRSRLVKAWLKAWYGIEFA